MDKIQLINHSVLFGVGGGGEKNSLCRFHTKLLYIVSSC